MPQDTTKQQNSTNKNDGSTLPPLPELKHVNPNPVEPVKPVNVNPMANPGMNPFNTGNTPVTEAVSITEPIEDKFPKVENIKELESVKPLTNISNPFLTKQEESNNKTAEVVKSNIKEKSLDNIELIISSGNGKKQSLLDILFAQGKISQEQFNIFKSEILSKNLNEETFVFDKGIVSHMDLLKAKSETYKIPFIDLSNMEIKKKLRICMLLVKVEY